MADDKEQNAKSHAYFLQRSAARLERLLIINAAPAFVQAELEVVRKRLRDLEAALGAKGPDHG